MFHRRPFAILAIAAFTPHLAAQGLELLSPKAATFEEAVSKHAIAFEGVVFDSAGAPAKGALVVSSAGGKALTGRNGRYRLEVRVPADARSIQITAVAADDGGVASTMVALPLERKTAWVPPLEVSGASTCQPSWLPAFGAEPGTNDYIRALAVFDDGCGPALYVAGNFTTAGGILAKSIAKWNGSTWEPLGSGLSLPAWDLAVFDDGSGPALYATGLFTIAGGVTVNRIARWDGSSWSPLGSGLNAAFFGTSLAVFDDGSGPALYVGGAIVAAGGVPALSIARWNGSLWSAVGSGLNDIVEELAVFDDGSGPALYAGGEFTAAGSVTVNRVAKWDGSSWSALGSGMTGPGDIVEALREFDDGNGPALYAGGTFQNAGGIAASNIAKWDGTSWAALGSGVDATLHALTVFDDGSGPALYVGGNFSTAGGVPASHVAKWDGSTWTTLGSGLSPSPLTLAVFDDGNGPALFAGGLFELAGGKLSNNVARWDGSIWEPLTNGMSDLVETLAVFDDGRGPALYAGGRFTFAGGGAPANHIARWDGSTWEPLESGVNDNVLAMTVFDDGSGPALFAGGDFTTAGGVPASQIAKWDGSLWSPLGGGVGGSLTRGVQALTVFDDGSGPALYAAGTFTVAGGVAANNIAKWDGSSWMALSTGLSGVIPVFASALVVFDDGNGPALHAGGTFTSAGGVAASHIARWDGSTWTALGSGLGGVISVEAMTVFDDGGGPALYAGGRFTSAGGVPANQIARWDGSLWSAVGGGLTGPLGPPVSVLDFAVLDHGCGSLLYAAGHFTTAGGVAASNIAQWDGSSWAPLGSGFVGPFVGTIQSLRPVAALTVFNDGSGPALYAGGGFRSSEAGDSFLAKWGSPDTTAPVIACPSAIVVDDRPVTGPGEVLTFLVTAKDEQDPSPSLECHPPSGSWFPRGTTLVLCTATDASGNQASCQFTVTVGAKVPEVLSSSPRARR